MEAQTCPICGKGSLKKNVRKKTFAYKDSTVTVPDYVTFKCGVCGEAIVDNKSLIASGKVLKELQRRVEKLLSGEEIKAVRKKFGYTQEEFAELIGGGKKALARYESGKVCQSRGMDNLLRILDAYPYTASVIKKDYHFINHSEGSVLYSDVWDQRSQYSDQGIDSLPEMQEAKYGT